MTSVLVDPLDRANVVWGYSLAQSSGPSTVGFIIVVST
jgi:hypothetical protein